MGIKTFCKLYFHSCNDLDVMKKDLSVNVLATLKELKLLLSCALHLNDRNKLQVWLKKMELK